MQSIVCTDVVKSFIPRILKKSGQVYSSLPRRLKTYLVRSKCQNVREIKSIRRPIDVQPARFHEGDSDDTMISER